MMPLFPDLSPARSLFNMFAPALAYVSVETKTEHDPEQSIGTAFHIGDHIFITARHVVEGNRITKIATTIGTTDARFGSFSPKEAVVIEGPYFHRDSRYDLAAIRLPDLLPPRIPFFPVAEIPHDEELLLRPIVVMGYPRVPGSKHPVLVCLSGNVSASFSTFFDNQQVLVLSTMARGGFSGGPALTPPHHSLGVVTRSLLTNGKPEELGFMSVVGPWPILEMLDQHGIMPSYLKTDLWLPYQKKLRELDERPSYFSSNPIK